MDLLLATDVVTMASNEAYPSTILWSHLLGIIAAVVSGLLFVFVFLASISMDHDFRRGKLPCNVKELSPQELKALEVSAMKSSVIPDQSTVPKLPEPYNPMYPSLGYP